MRLGAVRLCAAFACQLNGRAPAGPIAPVTYLADTLVSNLAGATGRGCIGYSSRWRSVPPRRAQIISICVACAGSGHISEADQIGGCLRAGR